MGTARPRSRRGWGRASRSGFNSYGPLYRARAPTTRPVVRPPPKPKPPPVITPPPTGATTGRHPYRRSPRRAQQLARRRDWYAERGTGQRRRDRCGQGPGVGNGKGPGTGGDPAARKLRSVAAGDHCRGTGCAERRSAATPRRRVHRGVDRRSEARVIHPDQQRRAQSPTARRVRADDAIAMAASGARRRFRRGHRSLRRGTALKRRTGSSCTLAKASSAAYVSCALAAPHVRGPRPPAHEMAADQPRCAFVRGASRPDPPERHNAQRRRHAGRRSIAER